MASGSNSLHGPPDFIFIERAEREAWLDMVAAAPADYAERSGVTSIRLPGAGLIANRDMPMAEFNRAMGIGIEQLPTAGQMDGMAEWLRAHANPARALQISPLAHTKVVVDWLQKRGLQPHGTGWANFWRGLSPVPDQPLPAALEVRRAKPRDAADFGAVMQAGFGLPPSFSSWFSGLVGRPNWNIYLAYEGGRPVASGALFIEGGWGWLGVDSTLPAYRKRGAQTALLSRRLSDGMAAGLAGFTGETGQPLPGQEASHTSYSNFLRAGFSLAYTRANYRVV